MGPLKLELSGSLEVGMILASATRVPVFGLIVAFGPSTDTALLTLSCSAYVPAETMTVPPAVTALMPSWIVANESQPKLVAGPAASGSVPIDVPAQLAST